MEICPDSELAISGVLNAAKLPNAAKPSRSARLRPRPILIADGRAHNPVAIHHSHWGISLHSACAMSRFQKRSWSESVVSEHFYLLFVEWCGVSRLWQSSIVPIA